MTEPQEPNWIEPGIDRHVFESEFAALAPELESDPEGSLPELADLVGRMLDELGLRSELAGGLDASELGRAFRAADDLARRARDGEDLAPGDVAFAVDQLIEVYESLLRATGSA